MRDEPSILDGSEAEARRVRNAMPCIPNQNNYDQRTGVTTGGTAFSGTPSWAWGYNSKGEVVKADSSETGFDRAYAYDGIGNRTSGGDLGSPISYTANALNQYSAIGSLNPSYDNDGNMTSGPLPANVNANSALIWDGENRLIEAQVNSGATVSYVYDSQSRRIAETVGSVTTVYVYDGWNPIAVYTIQSSQFTLHSSFTWGIDLSGSMQGAGGVGGLLSVTDGTGTYFPTFDGNGNVSEYLDSNGNIVAHYEYDPFGKTTISNGSKANEFAHRFSTKPLDLTNGLYYYGYRFYDPETGRWPSRDPIEEQGGINLYGFVENNGINWWDFLGLDPRGPGSRCNEVSCLTGEVIPAGLSLSSNGAIGSGVNTSGNAAYSALSPFIKGRWANRLLRHYIFDRGETITLSREEVKNILAPQGMDMSFLYNDKFLRKMFRDEGSFSGQFVLSPMLDYINPSGGLGHYSLIADVEANCIQSYLGPTSSGQKQIMEYEVKGTVRIIDYYDFKWDHMTSWGRQLRVMGASILTIGNHNPFKVTSDPIEIYERVIWYPGVINASDLKWPDDFESSEPVSPGPANIGGADFELYNNFDY